MDELNENGFAAPPAVDDAPKLGMLKVDDEVVAAAVVDPNENPVAAGFGVVSELAGFELVRLPKLNGLGVDSVVDVVATVVPVFVGAGLERFPKVKLDDVVAGFVVEVDEAKALPNVNDDFGDAIDVFSSLSAPTFTATVLDAIKLPLVFLLFSSSSSLMYFL